MRRILIALLLLIAQSAHAQIGIPNLHLPVSLPTQLPGERLLSAPGAQSDLRQLESVRRERVRDLLRRNRTTLESDPNGEAIVRDELLLYGPSDSEVETALRSGFTVARIETLEGLGVRIVILHAPHTTPTARALALLRSVLPKVTIDFDHIYLESGDAAASEPVSAGSAGPDAPLGRDAGGKIGLIDGGIDMAHPAFKDAVIRTHGCEEHVIPDAHGTAVASLMIGRAGAFHGARPGMALFAADVYCASPTGGSLARVLEALAWLARERVPAINVSLVGPPNATLERAIEDVLEHGHLIVAAVGNDGPSAPPLYPASYPGVIGVTAVDSRRHVLLEAARGRQVMFAAPGADIAAAQSPAGFQLVRGTSFAAPLVACLLAAQVAEPDKDAVDRAVAALKSSAIDLGTPGPDPVYGFGLVGADLGPAPALASARAR